jgi:hypothetical protein
MMPARVGGLRRIVQARSAQGISTTPIPAGQLRVIGAGRPLEPGIRETMESFFGTDFSSVRIHHGPAATSMGALAFTLGEQLHFATGRYAPTTREGIELLGHELAHVVQQREGRIANPYGQGVAIVQDPTLEAEADRLGQEIADAMWSGSRVGQPAVGSGRWRTSTKGTSTRLNGSIQKMEEPDGKREVHEPTNLEGEHAEYLRITASYHRGGTYVADYKVEYWLKVAQAIGLPPPKTDNHASLIGGAGEQQKAQEEEVNFTKWMALHQVQLHAVRFRQRQVTKSREGTTEEKRVAEIKRAKKRTLVAETKKSSFTKTQSCLEDMGRIRYQPGVHALNVKTVKCPHCGEKFI